MTGELDRRTPIPQTEEYYAALKMRHVPAVMLRFSDEFHGTGSKPSNFMRTQLYMMSWFGKYKTGGGSAPRSQANPGLGRPRGGGTGGPGRAGRPPPAGPRRRRRAPPRGT